MSSNRNYKKPSQQHSHECFVLNHKFFIIPFTGCFASALADDLNIAPALAALFDLMRGTNRLADSGELSKAGAAAVLAEFRSFDRVIDCFDVDAVPLEPEFPAEVTALAEARAAARKQRDFAESDRLRDEIAKLGFIIEDAPGGVWRLKKQ